MKKRRLKRWVKELLSVIIVILIGAIISFALCERSEQIDRGMNYEETY